MRALFFVLLLANVALLVLQLMQVTPAGVESGRLAQQLNAERITVIAPEAAAAQAAQAARSAQEQLARQRSEQERAAQEAQQARPADAAPPASASTSASTSSATSTAPSASTASAAAAATAENPGRTAPPAAADAGSSSLARAVCVELGDFSAQAAESFEPQLSRLSMTGIPQRRVVQPPPSYLVFLPPLPTEAAAKRRLAQVRDKGFADSAVIRDESPRRWGVSVGLFSKEELAIAQLDKLHKVGIDEARMGEHPLNSTRYAYRLPGVTEAGATRLAAVASGYSGVSMRACK